MRTELEMHELLIEDQRGIHGRIFRPFYKKRVPIPGHVLADAKIIYDLTKNEWIKHPSLEENPCFEDYTYRNVLYDDEGNSKVPEAQSVTRGVTNFIVAYENEDTGFYCGLHGKKAEANTSTNQLQTCIEQLESVILQTPTGENRNKLSDAAILIRLVISNKGEENEKEI